MLFYGLEGVGRFTWADGRKYTGGYKEGKPHGIGRMTKLDSGFEEREVSIIKYMYTPE